MLAGDGRIMKRALVVVMVAVLMITVVVVLVYAFNIATGPRM